MSFFFRNFILLLPTPGALTQNSHSVVSPASRNPLPQRRAGKPSAYSRSKEGLRENRCLDPRALTQPAASRPACHRDPAALGPRCAPSPEPRASTGRPSGSPAPSPRPQTPSFPATQGPLRGGLEPPDSHQRWPTPLLQFHQNGPL